jgi:hypothetical protein
VTGAAWRALLLTAIAVSAILWLPATYRQLVREPADATDPASTDPMMARPAASSASACQVELGEGASLGGMRPFSGDNPWNRDISNEPVDPNSTAIIAKTGVGTQLHPDFGSGKYAGAAIGIPYIVVPAEQPLVPIDFTEYPTQSDAGPYPLPPNAPIEGLGTTAGYSDRHVLVVQRDCSKPNQLGRLYETFRSFPVGNYPISVERWRASSGAIFDLSSDALRPAGWTSADAAGLPIFPGLVRYDEVAAGEIRHALRFSLAPGYTRKGYVPPATHHAGYGTTDEYAPFGMRVRLKTSVDISQLPAQVQVIARAMKTYGMLLADNGGNWFVGGAPDPRWNNDDLRWLGTLIASDFEVIALGTVASQ